MFVIPLLAAPMAIVWMIVTSSISIDSFIVGFLLASAILLMLKVNEIRVDPRRIPDQIVALVIYTVTLARDIWMSSVTVARVILNPNLPLKPGILKVYTQDAAESDFTAAFSAHGITITPGELVVDFDGSHTMYVHCLDVEASAQTSAQAQTRRLRLLSRIAGRG
ncbi:MAG: Na+/H+ antiporter subunit E [Anaerolineae bacterium]